MDKINNKMPKNFPPNLIKLELIEQQLRRLASYQETILSKIEQIVELLLNKPLNELNEGDRWNE